MKSTPASHSVPAPLPRAAASSARLLCLGHLEPRKNLELVLHALDEYAQVLEALDAGGDGQEAREPTFVGTRRYVRRQRSWFRRDHRVHWRDGAVDDLLSTTVAAWRHVS